MLHLLQTTKTDTEQSGYIETALRSSERLSELLSNVLDLSRIEANRIALQENVFSVAGMEQSISDVFAVQAGEKGLSLTVRTDPRIPSHLFGDEDRLRRILFNLVGNAVKFTDRGGIEVALDLLSAEGEEPCRIRFSVKDTGVGIPPELLEDVVQPFTQLGGDKAARMGAGLGLAIVTRLVDLMRGELTLQSVPGEGTTVLATLPFMPAAAPETPGAARPGRADCRGMRVLLVEDDSVNRLAMRGPSLKDGMLGARGPQRQRRRGHAAPRERGSGVHGRADAGHGRSGGHARHSRRAWFRRARHRHHGLCHGR
jgi:anti-sigma regulatory factor (Ser/Thr protein kinase)